MNTNFSEQLWIDFDLEVEFLVRFLVTWITYNSQKDNPEQRNFKDGQYWSYNSYPEFCKMLPGFSIQNIRTILNRCVKNGLLVVGNFNRKKYDNTNWYTLTEKGWSYFPREAKKVYPDSSAQSGSGVEDLNTPVSSNRPPVSSNRPIPEEPNNISNINITTSDVVNAYHEELPDCPKIKVVGNDLTKQIRSMMRNWPKYQKDGKNFTIDSFKDYLRYIKEHYSWFLKPYPTERGKIKRNNLTNLTREKNIVRIVNGEFSAT